MKKRGKRSSRILQTI